MTSQKLNLWTNGIGWHIQKEKKASANREPKISLLVQIGYKHKQRYAQMTPYKSFQIGQLDRS